VHAAARGVDAAARCAGAAARGADAAARGWNSAACARDWLAVALATAACSGVASGGVVVMGCGAALGSAAAVAMIGEAEGAWGDAAARATDASAQRALTNLRALELARGAAPNGDSADAAATERAIAEALASLPAPGEPGGSDAATRLLQQAAALTRDAMRARGAARSVRAAIDAEDDLARRRTELARSVSAALPECARELLLQSAEDLLFRRRSVDGSDELIAVGLATPAERASAGAAVREAAARLDDELLAQARADTAALATDPLAMRVRLLAGIARLTTADLAAAAERDASRGDERRTATATTATPATDAGAELPSTRARREASRLLEDAARTELPVPPVIRALLDLARARATDDATLRTRLLSALADSPLEPVARVARIERWRDACAGVATGAALPPFPTLAGDARFTELLSITAQLRARTDDAPASLSDAAQPLERALRATLAAGPFDAERALALERLAVAVAMRLDRRLRALALDGDAPPLLLALCVVAPEPAREDGAADTRPAPISSAQLNRLRPLIADRACAPWLGVPLARALQESGRTDDATATLVEFARVAPVAPKARDAIDLALAACRARAEREPNGESALDRALETATAAFPADPLRDAWLFERFDLALFPHWAPPDATRAAQLLTLVSNAPETALARDVRALELEVEAAAELEVQQNPRDAAGRVATERLARARTLLAELPTEATPRAQGTASDHAPLAPRLRLIEAWLLASAGKHADGLAAVERALSESVDDEHPSSRRVARRAAEMWHVILRLDTDAPTATAVPPAALLALTARDPDAARAANDALARYRAAAESARDAGDDGAARRIAERRILPIAPLGRGAEATRAHVLGELLAGNAARAVSLAEALLDATPPGDAASPPADPAAIRETRWLLAQALRALAPSDPAEAARLRARAFGLLRELSPLQAAERDDLWWSAQAAQLEMLADEPARAPDILARLNRLEAIDATLGGARLARRFAALRTRAESSMIPSTPSIPSEPATP
jgi:hypothetical protein